MSEVAVRVVVSGRVQGIGFRAWTVREARTRSLRGWVCNRGDGSVEALLIGTTISVGTMIEALRRGPRLAQVTGLVHEESRDDGTASFHERQTI